MRVSLPYHLRILARLDAEVVVQVAEPVTQRSVLEELEARYPVFRGTIHDHTSGRRRAHLRFFAWKEDPSHEPPDDELPERVVSGAEPFMVVGTMAGEEDFGPGTV